MTLLDDFKASNKSATNSELSIMHIKQKQNYPTLTKEQMDFVLRSTSPHSFAFNIQAMNQMYKLPINTEPTLNKLPMPNGENELASVRIKKFLKTIRDEANEGDQDKDGNYGGILATLERLEAVEIGHEAELVAHQEDVRDALTDIADWLGDMMVFIRSEAMKFGLPIEAVLEVIQGSNATKLPADGIPLYNEDGKFLKDMSRFVPPEPAIKTVLFGLQS